MLKWCVCAHQHRSQQQAKTTKLTKVCISVTISSFGHIDKHTSTQHTIATMHHLVRRRAGAACRYVASCTRPQSPHIVCSSVLPSPGVAMPPMCLHKRFSSSDSKQPAVWQPPNAVARVEEAGLPAVDEPLDPTLLDVKQSTSLRDSSMRVSVSRCCCSCCCLTVMTSLCRTAWC